jgi:hypothetical protein
MRIFPGDDISTADVEGMLGELSSNELIDVYAVEGRRYLQVAGWARDQKINRPSPSELPSKPAAGSCTANSC